MLQFFLLKYKIIKNFSEPVPNKENEHDKTIWPAH